MNQLILRANDRLYQSCTFIAGISLLGISLIIPWGIFARYVLGTGSRWPEPVSILLVAVFTFLGAAASYRANAHIAVSIITTRLPPALRRSGELLIQLLMLSICLFMLIWGAKLCMATWHQYNSTLTWLRTGIAYTPIPVSAGITALFVLERIFLGDQSLRRVVNLDAAFENEKEA